MATLNIITDDGKITLSDPAGAVHLSQTPCGPFLAYIGRELTAALTLTPDETILLSNELQQTIARQMILQFPP